MSKTIQDELREVRPLPQNSVSGVVGYRIPGALALRAADEIDRLRALVKRAYHEGCHDVEYMWEGSRSWAELGDGDES